MREIFAGFASKTWNDGHGMDMGFQKDFSEAEGLGWGLGKQGTQENAFDIRGRRVRVRTGVGWE